MNSHSLPTARTPRSAVVTFAMGCFPSRAARREEEPELEPLLKAMLEMTPLGPTDVEPPPYVGTEEWVVKATVEWRKKLWRCGVHGLRTLYPNLCTFRLSRGSTSYAESTVDALMASNGPVDEDELITAFLAMVPPERREEAQSDLRPECRLAEHLAAVISAAQTAP